MKSDCNQPKQQNREDVVLVPFWRPRWNFKKTDKDNFHPPVESIFCDCCSMCKKLSLLKLLWNLDPLQARKRFPQSSLLSYFMKYRLAAFLSGPILKICKRQTNKKFSNKKIPAKLQFSGTERDGFWHFDQLLMKISSLQIYQFD